MRTIRNEDGLTAFHFKLKKGTVDADSRAEMAVAQLDALRFEAFSELYGTLRVRSTLREAAMAQLRRVMRRKNMLVDQRKLDAAKAAMGAPTETAAVDAALDLVVFRAEVFRELDALLALGGLGAPAHRAG